MLKNKNILLGITGSIAAYKAPLIIRELIKMENQVMAIMTPSALKFITKLTISNITKSRVFEDMFEEDNQTSGAWHIHLAHWCDAMLIAPCTATTISRLSTGLCDNALTTVATALPKDKPLILAPAMDSDMWHNSITQNNVKKLIDFGVKIIPPEEGELSSGLSGDGRLAAIPNIIQSIDKILSFNSNKADTNSNKSKVIDVTLGQKDNTSSALNIQQAIEKPIYSIGDAVEKDKWTTELEFTKLKESVQTEKKKSSLAGKKVLITAGPTQEKIDAVRFISNFSSGKMGFALSKIAAALEADVVLISGPVSLNTPNNVRRIDVVSAKEMLDAVNNEYSNTDIFIFAAAVADFTPLSTFQGKIKKSNDNYHLTLPLKQTDDILATIGSRKKDNQIVVGFALESNNELENARKKLKEKNCDFIVLNSANKPNSGFQGDMNTITILAKDGTLINFPAMTKEECALEIFKQIL